MSSPISKRQYREEWVVAFQRGETYLKYGVTKEQQFSGNQAIFAIQAAAPAMVSRGVNGLIPSRNRVDSQVTINLKERHTKETRTSFNIFTAQSDIREAMQNAGALTAAREIDEEIITALETATTVFNGGTAITTSRGRMAEIKARLLNNDVYANDMITFVHTPTSWERLLTLEQFSSADYMDVKPLMGDAEAPKKWNGAIHMVHTGLPGVGTATASCFAFGKAAIGHAINTGDIRTAVGYDEEDDYSYSRHTIFHGATILQQSGVIEWIHDDTAAIT